MTEPLDILDDRDPVAMPFFGAIAVHATALALLFFGWYWMNRRPDTLGEMHPGGGPAYAVSPVHNIPIPQQQAPQNPVASDTQSTVPSAPAKREAEKKQIVPEKNAFEIPEKKKRKAEQTTHQQQYQQPAPPNQVYSQSRQALSNPMYSAQSGSGQVGIGPNSPLGNRLGWYAELVRQAIAQNWRTSGLDARSQSSPAIIGFSILRNGAIENPRVIQSSGNPDIDNSALRAVYDATLPALPPQIGESSITAQFTFNLR